MNEVRVRTWSQVYDQPIQQESGMQELGTGDSLLLCLLSSLYVYLLHDNFRLALVLYLALKQLRF